MIKNQEDTSSDRFDLMLGQVSEEVSNLYHRCRHVRVVTGFGGRQFVVYSYNEEDEAPKVHDLLTVKDVSCTFDNGLELTVHSRANKETDIIDCMPHPLFDYPFLAFIPLHARLRLDPVDESGGEWSLGLPIVLRTRSRLHLREPGVTYVETTPTFKREFGDILIGA